MQLVFKITYCLAYRQIKGNCAESFTEYWTCLDYSNLAELRQCRKQQKEFDSCVLEKLGWERPDLGDLSKVGQNIHYFIINQYSMSFWSSSISCTSYLWPLPQVTKVATSRPVPENPYHSRPRPEPNPPIEAELQPSKHGSRLFFWNW